MKVLRKISTTLLLCFLAAGVIFAQERNRISISSRGWASARHETFTSAPDMTGGPGTLGDAAFSPGERRHPHAVMAQAPERRPERPGEPPRNRPNEERFRKWLFARLTEYLKLDDAAAKRFEPVFNEYSSERGRLMREHSVLLRRIDQDADNTSVPMKNLQELSEQYKKVDREMWQGRQAFYRKSAEVLTDRQMIKLLIYEDKVKEDMFRRMRNDRDGRRGGHPDRSG